MRRLYKYAVDLFIELLTQVQGKRMKPYRCNDADTKAWNTFTDYCNEKKILVSEELIRKFIEYGLQSWFNKDMSFTQKQNVRFSWIFGAQAIKRWNALPATARQYYVQSQLKTDYNVRRKQVKSRRLSKLLTEVRESEEKFKQQYLNTPRGLLWCMANTTLFFHKSPSCAICEYKDECKNNLRTNMPSVYKSRGYK